MKRLLFVRRTYGFGGVEVILLDWLKRIDYSRYEVIVSSPTDVFSALLRDAGSPAKFVALTEAEVTHVYGRYQPEKGINDLVRRSFWRFFPIWFRFLWRLRPDAVVFLDGDFFTTPLACVLAAFIVTLGNVSMTIHSPNKLQQPPRKTTKSHFGLPGLGLWWYRQIWLPLWPWIMRAKFVRRVLTSNRSMRDRIISFYGYPVRKMGLVGHGVDTARFRPSQAARARYRQEQGIPVDAFVIVSTSRLSSEKGVDRLVTAFKEVASSNPNIWLLLTGKGPLRTQIENLIGKCDAGKRMKLLGHVEDVCPVVQIADAYVLASTFEGSPVALMEAMATGLVCLMSGIAGSDEMIDDGRDGFLVESTTEKLKEALQKVLAMSPSELQRIGRSAREKMVEDYELENAVRSAFAQLGIESKAFQTGPVRSSGVSGIQEVIR